MNGNGTNIPPKLREIIEDFEISEGREKIELLVDYAERMPPLPDWLRGEHDRMVQVHECMTPTFVQATIEDGKMTFHFDVPAESPTVRGYAAILGEGLKGATPQEVLAVPADFYEKMGLERVLTSQRLNGLSAILAHMKRLAMQTLSGQSE
jgi:cysteine desulfuration protein SufE